MEEEIKIEPCDLNKIKDEPGISFDGNEFEELDPPKTECVCLVCTLLKNAFTTYSVTNQADIIAMNRPMPNRNDLQENPGNLNLNQELYKSFNWLTACEFDGKLYCWPCLLFSGYSGVWSGEYCLDNEIIVFHVNTKLHMQSVLKLRIHQLEASKLTPKADPTKIKHNLMVDKNREMIKRLVGTVCFLLKHDLGNDPKFYKSLIQLVGQYDPDLKIFLEDHTEIQTDIIRSIATVMRASIKEQMEKVFFASIILVEATDQKEFSKPALIVRYVNPQGDPEERFLKIFHDDTPLYDALSEIIDNLGCGSKLVAQSCDGGSIASSNIKKLMERYPKAHFMHCFGLKLDTLLAQKFSNLAAEPKFFFKILNDMADFFSKQTLWPEVSIAFPDNRQRWSQMGDLIKILNLIRGSLIQLFKRILETRESYEPETFNAMITYLKLLEEDEVFNFLLQVFADIFPQVNVISSMLKTFEETACRQKIKEIINNFGQKMDQFEHFWGKVSFKPDSEPAAKKRRTEVKDRMKKIYAHIIYNLVEQLNMRFGNLDALKFLKIQKSLGFLVNLDYSQLERYDELINCTRLDTQISSLNQSCPHVFGKEEDVLSLLKFLKQHDLDKALTEITKICELMLTLPLSNLDVSKRICEYVTKGLSEVNMEHFEDFALVFIEKEYLKELVENSRFYDDVIERFTEINSSLELKYY